MKPNSSTLQRFGFDPRTARRTAKPATHGAKPTTTRSEIAEQQEPAAMRYTHIRAPPSKANSFYDFRHRGSLSLVSISLRLFVFSLSRAHHQPALPLRRPHHHLISLRQHPSFRQIRSGSVSLSRKSLYQTPSSFSLSVAVTD